MRLLWIVMWFVWLGNAGLMANQLEKCQVLVQLEKEVDYLKVEITSTITVDSGALFIPLRVIGNGLEQLRNVEALIEMNKYQLELDRQNDRVAMAKIPFIPDIAADKPIELILTYQAPRGNSQKITVPVLFVDWKPEAASEDIFSAFIDVPEGYSLTSIFPSMRWKKEVAGKEYDYSFSLQSIPAWIKFKIYKGAFPLVTLDRLIDFGVLLVLLILILVGWRRLKNKN